MTSKTIKIYVRIYVRIYVNPKASKILTIEFLSAESTDLFIDFGRLLNHWRFQVYSHLVQDLVQPSHHQFVPSRLRIATDFRGICLPQKEHWWALLGKRTQDDPNGDQCFLWFSVTRRVSWVSYPLSFTNRYLILYVQYIHIQCVYIYILYIHIYIKCVRTISCQNMFYRLSMLLQVHTEPLSLLWDGFSYLRNFSWSSYLTADHDEVRQSDACIFIYV